MKVKTLLFVTIIINLYITTAYCKNKYNKIMVSVIQGYMDPRDITLYDAFVGVPVDRGNIIFSGTYSGKSMSLHFYKNSEDEGFYKSPEGEEITKRWRIEEGIGFSYGTYEKKNAGQSGLNIPSIKGKKLDIMFEFGSTRKAKVPKLGYGGEIGFSFITWQMEYIENGEKFTYKTKVGLPAMVIGWKLKLFPIPNAFINADIKAYLGGMGGTDLSTGQGGAVLIPNGYTIEFGGGLNF